MMAHEYLHKEGIGHLEVEETTLIGLIFRVLEKATWLFIAFAVGYFFRTIIQMNIEGKI